MDAQRIAVDAVVALTDCDRDVVTAFIRRFYLAGVKDPKRLTFKGLQALTRADRAQSPASNQSEMIYAAAVIGAGDPPSSGCMP